MGKHAAFIGAVVLQLVLLSLVPAKKLVARYQGTEITLQTRPVDPYDLLAGYYVTLAYAVERVDASMRPDVSPDTPVWLELAPALPAWRLVAVHTDAVATPNGHVLIRAVWKGRNADIPEASRLYIAESERHQVDEALKTVRGKGLIDLRVSADGTPVVMRLRVRDQIFGD